jgi:hypothetical protein
MHPQFSRGLALVAAVFFEDRDDEPLFEFAHSFGVENSALLHLLDECFELVFHLDLQSSSFFGFQAAGDLPNSRALRASND